MTKVKLEITNCMDCPFHNVEMDPDSYAYFSSDDEKVVCMKANRNVTVACRPHHKRDECEIPLWCPLLVNQD